jgi:uncharacterized damage-inducible protein DinB
MIPMLQSLWAHLTWADDQILKTVNEQEGAFAEDNIRKLLHHIINVERFFLTLFQARPIDMESGKQLPAGREEFERLYDAVHSDGAAYVARLNDGELARTIEFPVPAFKDFHPSIADALMQVILHSEHHRGQVALRLRAMGGKPPVLDYIVWVRTIR